MRDDLQSVIISQLLSVTSCQSFYSKDKMSDSRKRKKQYYLNASKRTRQNQDLCPGVKGFIITCNQKEKNAVAEGYRLLNEFADACFGAEKLTKSGGSDNEEEDIGVEAALEKEIQGIKELSKAERRFQSLHNKANNVIFIKTTIDNPNEFASSIYEAILASKTRKTKYCLRFLPVISTCYAKVDVILKHAKPIIENYFHGAEKPFTFHIMWKTRCNNTLKRDDVFPKLLEYIHSIEKGHTTDYDNPVVVLNLDIIGNVCCFGVLKDFYKYKKYNLDQLVENVECQAENNQDKMNDNKVHEKSNASGVGTDSIVEKNDFDKPNMVAKEESGNGVTE